MTMTCNAIVVPGLIDSTNVAMEWTGVFGHSVSGSGISRGVVENSGSTYSLAVTFTSLMTSHGMTYTCRSTVHITEINIIVTSTDEEDLIVQGNYKQTHTQHFLCNPLTLF